MPLAQPFHFELNGVPGRLVAYDVRADSPCFEAQKWRSIKRPAPVDYGGGFLSVEVRYDDSCHNGYNTFAITGDVRGSRGQEMAFGCLHEDIAQIFPELAPLIKWHLCAADGPLHYLANTLYLASDADHNGLRAGETRLRLAKGGVPIWELVAHNAEGVLLSDTPTGAAYKSAAELPLFILQNRVTAESPPALPVFEWRPAVTTGEGKPRDFDGARAAAIWPEASDATLSLPRDALKAALEARLPGLLASFREAVTGAGLRWAPRPYAILPVAEKGPPGYRLYTGNEKTNLWLADGLEDGAEEWERPLTQFDREPITDKGKFEGCPLYVRLAHAKAFSGFASEEFGGEGEPYDYHARVEFEGAIPVVFYRERADGIVMQLSAKEYEEAEEDNRRQIEARDTEEQG